MHGPRLSRLVTRKLSREFRIAGSQAGARGRPDALPHAEHFAARVTRTAGDCRPRSDESRYQARREELAGEAAQPYAAPPQPPVAPSPFSLLLALDQDKKSYETNQPPPGNVPSLQGEVRLG